MSDLQPRPNALVVYESMFGNTEAIASAVVQGLRNGGCDAVKVDARGDDAVPRAVDLLVLGAPTHAFSLSRPSTRADAVSRGASETRSERGLREWLTDARAAGGPRPPAAVFDTRAARVRRLPMSAAHTAERLARRAGFRLVGRGQGFLVEDVAGPLVDGEVERARAWGQALAESLSGDSR